MSRMGPILAAAITIIFHHPADCLRPCDDFLASARQPAMQRRLALLDVKFETIPSPEKETPALALHDASGKKVMSWHDYPDWLMLADVLSLLEIAKPHILEARRATDPAVAERESILAVLSLGDRARGKALLEQMQSSSESKENRQLAAVWLERLNQTRTNDVLAKLAREGTTARVRVDAWMAIGDAHLARGKYGEAVESYDRAAGIAGDDVQLQNARVARQRAAMLAIPVLGLTPVTAGRRAIQPRNVPKKTATVEYRLDGKLVTTAKRAPFIASINFGRIPARQVLDVAAKDRGGKVIERSRAVVNERSEAFGVNILEPAGPELAGKVEVSLDARIPLGRTVDEVLVEWNGKRLARMTAPPYRARIDVGERESGVLRAVLRLDDGSEAEDVLVANTGMLLEAEAHVVEVPVYFDGATPPAGEVTAREAGKVRRIERVVAPDETPLLVGLLIDSSRSMSEHMLDVQEAAMRFVEAHLQPRDQAMVVSFSGVPHIVQRATSDRRLLARAILSLRPKGSTALHDAIVTALLQVQSTGSRKALVVFSDGLDVVSVFSDADVNELARRTGVPIYVLAFTPKEAAYEPRVAFAKNDLMGMSRRTGAKAFDVRTLEHLDQLWTEIGEDLKRQSLVIYRTDTVGAEWRPLELTVNGKPMRAPSGVYVMAEEQ
jgi:VWFA-related protein